jgi:hypothetical protein
VCPRGVATRQGEPKPGPVCPDTLAENIVTWRVRDLEGVCNGAIRALAKAGVCGAKVTGMIDGTDRWWLDHHGRCRVVPATARMAVTADALAQVAAGEGMTPGRRVHTVRHGQGRVAETQRLATGVVGMTGLTTEDGVAKP